MTERLYPELRTDKNGKQVIRWTAQPQRHIPIQKNSMRVQRISGNPLEGYPRSMTDLFGSPNEDVPTITRSSLESVAKSAESFFYEMDGGRKITNDTDSQFHINSLKVVSDVARRINEISRRDTEPFDSQDMAPDTAHYWRLYALHTISLTREASDIIWEGGVAEHVVMELEADAYDLPVREKRYLELDIEPDIEKFKKFRQTIEIDGFVYYVV